MTGGLMSIYCIVLNWNGWRDTIACLESLRQISNPRFSILVVDNGSTDDSVPQIRRAYPNVEILETGSNLGFGAGNNRGIDLVLSRGAEYVWLLNNDTLVTRTTLSELMSTLSATPNAGEVGSVLYYAHERNKVQAWGGGRVNLWTGRSVHFRRAVKDRDLDYLTAASVILPSQVLRFVGKFDEGYFMYWEDTDLSYRIRRAGYVLTVAPRAAVLHKEGASSGGESPILDRYMIASGVRFLRKYSYLPTLSIICMVSARAAKRAIARDWGRVHGVLTGLRGYGRN